jgi:hypothetical protein
VDFVEVQTAKDMAHLAEILFQGIATINDDSTPILTLTDWKQYFYVKPIFPFFLLFFIREGDESVEKGILGDFRIITGRDGIAPD